MTGPDNGLAGALADADRQMAHVDATLEHLVADAAALLAERGDPAAAWALLSVKLVSQLHDRPQFLADMLSRMAIKEATR